MIIIIKKICIPLITVMLLAFLNGCGGSKGVRNADSFELAKQASKSSLNKKISNYAAIAKSTESDLTYHLGAGDVLELTVFQVNELNKKIRVNGRGQIILPLLGTINVKGKSIADVEKIITDKLSANFLQNPQVSLFIEDYRSQQITVMGAVANPNVYSVRQSHSIFEMLSLAGGMTDEASDKIRVKTAQRDAKTNKIIQLDLLLSIRQLLEGSDQASTIRLRGGDSVLVPEAGYIFVEGAVKNPGSYKMEGSTNVLKAIAMAGGVHWEGKETRIQVIREISGEPISVDVDLTEVRSTGEYDVKLQDGDVVVVGYSATKRALSGFFKTAGQIFGYNLNR